MFMRVEDVAEEMGVSVSYAYKLIRKLNKELQSTGCITIPGRIDDLAPRIEFLGNDAKASFHNQLGRYTLLNFWAAYDAESRARNVQLANEVNKFGPDKIAMCSISMDEKESIFTETVKIDKLDLSTQFHEGLGKESELYKKYDLRKGFKNFLINDEGVIIAANVTPEKLTEILKAI